MSSFLEIQFPMLAQSGRDGCELVDTVALRAHAIVNGALLISEHSKKQRTSYKKSCSDILYLS